MTALGVVIRTAQDGVGAAEGCESRIQEFYVAEGKHATLAAFLVSPAEVFVFFLLGVEGFSLGLIGNQTLGVYQALHHLHILTADPRTLGSLRYRITTDKLMRGIEARRKPSWRRSCHNISILHIFWSVAMQLSMRMRLPLFTFIWWVSFSEVGVDYGFDVWFVSAVVGGVLEVDELIGAVEWRVVGYVGHS